LIAATALGEQTIVVLDQVGVGLVELSDISHARRPVGPGDDGYLTIIDPRSASTTVIVPESQAAIWRSTTKALVSLGVAGEMLGVVTRLLEDATTYAKQRVQFGRPIASYQAIQHILAWAATERHQLVSLYDIAVARTVTGDPDVELSLTTKAMAGRVLHSVAQAAIQVSGGISFTWEYPQHWFHRRGLLLDQLAGPSADLIAALGRQIRTRGTLPDLFSIEELAG
jgi:hypothetical protein